MGKITKKIKDKIISLYKDGYSSVKIADMFDVSQSYVSRIVKSEKLTRDRYTILNKNNEILKTVISLYKKGLGCDEISNTLNIPKHNVKYYIKKEGIMREPKRINENEYKDFWYESGRWYGHRKCPSCGDDIICYAQTQYY
jgi:orotate phosphoribosyltransferase-like protein